MTTATSRDRTPADGSLTLTASLRPAALDARRGIVRLHPEVLAALDVNPGDPVLLTAGRTTAGVAASTDGTAARGLLLADDLTLGNLRIPDGGQVTVRPAPLRAARSVTVAGEANVVTVVTPETLRLALLGKVVTSGDNVSLLPQDVDRGHEHRPLVDAARRSLSTAVGLGWTSALLTVVDADPDEAGVVTLDTVVRWQDGTATVGSGGSLVKAGGTVAAVEEDVVPIDQLAGLKAQAGHLTELLDLGFHHREVLARLGTSAQLGVLITGPAGAGKTTMARSVAAAVHASVTHLWAAGIAALAVDAAAGALRDAAARVRAEKAGVLLITDVEAIAPRDGAGPLATVLRQVIGETVSAGAAVLCTTSRPEAVATSLRLPGVLDHEIAIPLPDNAGRRDLLGVLSRSIPLAADVSLDDVAGRTPGFVAADLAALLREAGVRAALRQRDAEQPTVAQSDLDSALGVVRPTSMAESTLEVATVTLDEVGDMTDVKEALTEAVLWPLRYPDTFTRLGIDPPRGVLMYGPPGCGKTFLVRALAGTAAANVLSVKGAELLSKWVGESELAVRELFRRARDAAPSLVFLDEVDALAPRRGQSTDGGTTDRVVAALLTELDGVEALRNVVVVGATNRPDLIDPALLRPGRLERLVYVPPPDAEARAAILRAAAKRVPLSSTVDLDAVGADLEGFSSADCAALIREAALTAMRESMDSAEVTAAHLDSARKRTRPSLDPRQVAALAAYADGRTA